MATYRIIFDGEMQDEVFNSESDAEEYALELSSWNREGAEILNMSNPGDYPYDDATYQYPDYEIVEE